MKKKEFKIRFNESGAYEHRFIVEFTLQSGGSGHLSFSLKYNKKEKEFPEEWSQLTSNNRHEKIVALSDFLQSSYFYDNSFSVVNHPGAYDEYGWYEAQEVVPCWGDIKFDSSSRSYFIWYIGSGEDMGMGQGSYIFLSRWDYYEPGKLREKIYIADFDGNRLFDKIAISEAVSAVNFINYQYNTFR